MTGTVRLTFSADRSIAHLALGSEEERAITLTPDRLSSFREALETVRTSGARGLVISSPTVDSFCVGADISLIQGVTDPNHGRALAQQGQEVYDILEDLPCITVAAISGPCVGGGCEMVLACDHRVLADHKASSIGLPETKLGILPGFGGTYRLPRVVGLPKALDIILGGKTLRPQQALKAGLVDEVVPVDNLISRATEIAQGKSPIPRKRSLSETVLTKFGLGRRIVLRRGTAQVAAATKGFYPAQPAALEITVGGIGKSRSHALQLEAEALGKLIVSNESKALVHLFYLTETAKALGKSKRSEIENLPGLVIGAGVMGAGIAGSLARNDHQVIVKDTSEGALDRGRAHTTKEVSKLRYLSSFERAAVLSRIDWLWTSSPTEERTGIVIEAVFEDMNLKKEIFRSIATRVSETCILATNTSSLSVSEMATAVAHPERFVGMHFFNPVEKMPLVEIIRGAETSEATIATVAALATQIGKFPIVVEDVPGFLVNRILIPYLNEALFLLQAGLSVEEIDGAATSFGMPMGPIRLLDEVGLDVAAHVSKVMTDGYGDRMAVPPFAQKFLALGRKGRKSGAGFYDYDGKNATPWRELQPALELPNHSIERLSRGEITERLIFHLVNEAMKCLNEGVAGADRELAKKQIDLGTVMGIGFPPFRGGVLYYAERVGLDTIRDRLSTFAASYGSRYEPFSE